MRDTSVVNINTPNINLEYGTMSKTECKCIFINLSGWVYAESDNKLINLGTLNKVIRNRVNLLVRMFNDYKSHFTSFDLSESIYGLKTHSGYLSLEITIYMFGHIDIHSDALKTEINAFSDLLVETMNSCKGIQVTKRKKKN